MIVTVDTGGTKTLVASFTADGKIGEQIKFETPSHEADYATLLREILVTNYADKPVKAIVIALPGIIRGDIAVWCNNLKWKNFNVKQALRGVLNNAPIYVENDANLAGLAETRTLRSIPTSSLYVTVSTGIGSGVITNGYIDPGLRYSEAGRALVEFDGVVQEWEKFASGKAIHAVYGKYARDITDERTWKKIADRISRGFLAVIPVIQPDIIIIGGSIGTYFERYGHFLTGILKEKMPPHIPVPKIVQASHPEQAVIYGCFYYGKDQLADKSA